MILHVHSQVPVEIDSTYITNCQPIFNDLEFDCRIHFSTKLYIPQLNGSYSGINVLETKETIEKMIEIEKFNESFENKLLD